LLRLFGLGHPSQTWATTAKAWRHDKRYVQATITPAGRRLIATVFPAHAGRISEVIGRLTSGEQEELGALCRKLVKANAEAFSL